MLLKCGLDEREFLFDGGSGARGWKIPRRSVIVEVALEKMTTKTQEAAEGKKSPKKAVILETMLALSNK